MQLCIGYIGLNIDTHSFLGLDFILEFNIWKINCCYLKIDEPIALTVAVIASLDV